MILREKFIFHFNVSPGSAVLEWPSGLRRQRISYNVRDGRAANQNRQRCRAKMNIASSDWPPIFLIYIVRVIMVRGPF